MTEPNDAAWADDDEDDEPGEWDNFCVVGCVDDICRAANGCAWPKNVPVMDDAPDPWGLDDEQWERVWG